MNRQGLANLIQLNVTKLEADQKHLLMMAEGENEMIL
jgi:hypothetical protein